MKKAKGVTENLIYGTQHCLDDIPYRMIKFARSNQKTPLYDVVDSDREALASKKALKEAFKIHGGVCFYCKQKIGRRNLSLDHVEPKRLGRNSHLQNLVLAHKACNARKGDRRIEAFNPDAGREWLSALLKQVQDRLNKL